MKKSGVLNKALEIRNLIPIIITACNTVSIGVFGDDLVIDTFSDLITQVCILYFFLSDIMAFALIIVLTVRIIKNREEDRGEYFPYCLLALNIPYFFWLFFLLYGRLS